MLKKTILTCLLLCLPLNFLPMFKSSPSRFKRLRPGMQQELVTKLKNNREFLAAKKRFESAQTYSLAENASCNSDSKSKEIIEDKSHVPTLLALLKAADRKPQENPFVTKQLSLPCEHQYIIRPIIDVDILEIVLPDNKRFLYYKSLHHLASHSKGIYASARPNQYILTHENNNLREYFQIHAEGTVTPPFEY